MNIIVVKKGPEHYTATDKDQKLHWDSGRTPAEAIGNLIITWPITADVRIEGIYGK